MAEGWCWRRSWREGKGGGKRELWLQPKCSAFIENRLRSIFAIHARRAILESVISIRHSAASFLEKRKKENRPSATVRGSKLVRESREEHEDPIIESTNTARYALLARVPEEELFKKDGVTLERALLLFSACILRRFRCEKKSPKRRTSRESVKARRRHADSWRTKGWSRACADGKNRRTRMNFDLTYYSRKIRRRYAASRRLQRSLLCLCASNVSVRERFPNRPFSLRGRRSRCKHTASRLHFSNSDTRASSESLF